MIYIISTGNLFTVEEKLTVCKNFKSAPGHGLDCFCWTDKDMSASKKTSELAEYCQEIGSSKLHMGDTFIPDTNTFC
jgi:hypothetical protein